MAKGNLPTFLIIGAAKCGTTSLASYLDAHPQIGMAKPKELNFFSLHWEDGLDSYRRRFAGIQSAIRGEASPSYTRAPLIEGVPERIVSVLPDVNLVYVVRHPVDRIRSEYLHRLHLGKESARSLNEALLNNPRYLAVSRYAYQIDQYLHHFPRRQLFVLTTERLRSDRVGAIRDVLTFVGADPSILPGNLDQILNRSDEKLRIPRGLDPLRTLWRSARLVTGRLPTAWRHRARTRLGRPISSDATHLAPDHEKRIWEALETDLTRLREIVGPEIDLWENTGAN